MRINQQLQLLRSVGAAPVSKTPDYMSALGGRLKGWGNYQAAKALANARYQQQMKAMRQQMAFLEERYKYQFPITDLVG